MFDQGVEDVGFFVGISDGGEGAKGDDGSVVHGVVECGSGENKAVDVGDCDACGHTFVEGVEHSAGGCAVNVEVVIDANVNGGDDIGLSFYGEPNVAVKGFVEDGVDGFFVINPAIGNAFDLGAGCWLE